MIFTKNGTRYMIDRWGYVLRLRYMEWEDWQDEWVFFMGGAERARLVA